MATDLSKNEIDAKGKVKVIEEPENIQIMLEETRRKILAVLGTGIEESEGKKRFSMSVSEITHQLNALHPMSEGKQRFKQTAIYHHVEILKEANFITVDQELSGVTTFYCRTAPVFVGSTVLASSIDQTNTDEPLNERLKEKSQHLLKAFDFNLEEIEIVKEFEKLMNLYSKRSHQLNRVISNDIKHLENEKAIDVFRMIWAIWACADPEIVEIASKIKNFLKKDV